MSLPANLRVNVGVPFPAMVKGGGPVTISKTNGVWTVGLGATQLGVLPAGFDATTFLTLLQNSLTGTWYQASVQQLITGALQQRLVKAAGNILVQANDRIILVKQDVPQAVNIVLPAAALRQGAPVTVKDLAGVAAANNLTLVPNGVETIDGAANLVLNDNFEAVTLYPVTAAGGQAGWWIG